MAKYPNIKLTQKGLDMAINADKTKKLIYTHIEIGDGRLTNNEDILNLTAIKSRKIYADIADINNDTNNQVTLETTVSNKVVDEGFYAREIGIYAKLGEDGEDILYGYANAGDNCDYMPDKTQPIDELKLRITLIVGNVDNVTAVIDSSIIFITLADCRREIQKHNIDLLAHDNLARKDDIYTKLEVDTKLNSKANTLHGNHVPETESANNTRFLRNDNTWQTVTPDNIGTYHKTEVDSRVNSKVSKSGDTMAGALTASTFYTNDWFRCNENCGIYWQKWGGGWYMEDSEWMRVFNNKSIYTPGRIRCEGGFEGTATNAINFNGHSLSNILNLINAANTGIVEERLEQNGYVKFKNGLIIQWMNCDESNSRTDYKYFPRAFTRRIFYIHAISYHYNNKMYVSWVENFDTTKFLCGLGPDYSSDINSKNGSMFVFAIGI